MNLSTNQISFLKDLPSNIKVDMSSEWRHHFFEVLSEIPSFIKLIGDGKIYLITLNFGVSKSFSKPRLELAAPILINNKSNPSLILQFVIEQWESSGFDIKPGNNILLFIKFKRIWLTEK